MRTECFVTYACSYVVKVRRNLRLVDKNWRNRPQLRQHSVVFSWRLWL